jgi:AraC-like DNA-binding protein
VNLAAMDEYERTKLTKRCVAASGDFQLEDVRCDCSRSAWSAPEEATAFTIVFVRRGCFRRRVEGVESLLDAASVYLERPGQEQQIAHPCDGGDACTQIAFPHEVGRSLFPEHATPTPRLTTPEVDLAQRLLLRASLRLLDDFELVEGLLSLAAEVLRPPEQRPQAMTRPGTALARRRVVDVVREAISADPTLGLPELAREAAVSPHHLSRLFRAETGETISRYRNRIRVRLALERLAEGEQPLARLAADLGFADQAHLTRVVRTEVGQTPSSLRAAFAVA